MMYQGLRNKRFYWEVINTARKVLLLSISAFMATFSMYYKALSAVLVCISMQRIQKRLKPYKNPINNRLENLEIVTSAITFFSGIIFVSEEDQVAFINSIAFIGLLIE